MPVPHHFFHSFVPDVKPVLLFILMYCNCHTVESPNDAQAAHNWSAIAVWIFVLLMLSRTRHVFIYLRLHYINYFEEVGLLYREKKENE